MSTGILIIDNDQARQVGQHITTWLHSKEGRGNSAGMLRSSR